MALERLGILDWLLCKRVEVILLPHVPATSLRGSRLLASLCGRRRVCRALRLLILHLGRGC